VATSRFVTVGTPDANGAKANFNGFVAYRAQPGDPSTPQSEADGTIDVQLNDVRRRDDLSDYTGELQLRGSIRITDNASGPLQNEPATGEDFEFPVSVPCAATPDPDVGATCSASTTLNAAVPGMIVEGRQTNFELGTIEVFDGGAAGVAGAPDATLFAVQGLFTP
jgi:hypothetical protein